MTVIQLVKSLERRIEIRDYIVHFIDGSQCNFLKLDANELELEVTSFHWNNHNDELHIYVEEVMQDTKGVKSDTTRIDFMGFCFNDTCRSYCMYYRCRVCNF